MRLMNSTAFSGLMPMRCMPVSTATATRIIISWLSATLLRASKSVDSQTAGIELVSATSSKDCGLVRPNR